MKRMKLAALCLASIFFASCSHSAKTSDPPAAVNVAAVKAARGPISRNIVLSAEFKPFQEVDLHAKVAGYVKNIYVDIGDHVKQGQVLAVLEIPEMRDEVAQAQADVSQRQKEVISAQAAYRVSHLEYQRLAAAAQARPNLIAQQDIDNAEGNDQTAKARLETAKAALASAIANESRVKTLYAYATITAPFTGVVTRRDADVGTMIQAGTASQTQTSPLVRLSQNDLLRLTVPVPETAAPFIRVGAVVDVSVPALHKIFKGRVARFADQLDLSTRTMPTEIDVPNPAYRLVPGMYAETTLALARKSDAMTLPIQAVHQEDSGSIVFLIQNGKIEKRPVKIGIQTPDRVEILSGLENNDAVALGDVSQIPSNQIVKPIFRNADEH